MANLSALFYCCRPTVKILIVFVAALAGASVISGPLRGHIIRILFGSHQWKFGQYCGTNYTNEQVSSIDQRVLSLYDGSLLSSIDGQSSWSVILSRLDESNQVGLESREELGVTCSTHALGYADSTDEQLSNEPYRSDTECQRQLNELFAFVKTLTSELGCRRSGGSQLCRRHDDTTNDKSGAHNPGPEFKKNFDLKLWQQIHSFGRLPSGPPYRQHLLPGDYDNCARLESTRYCLGAYGRGRPSSANISASSANGRERSSHIIGMCLPRSCSSEFLKGSRELVEQTTHLVELNMPDLAAVGPLRLNDVFCPPALGSAYRKFNKDWLSILLASLPIVWASVIIYSTFIRSINPHSSGSSTSKGDSSVQQQDTSGRERPPPSSSIQKLLDSFDLKANWWQFLDARHLDSRLAGLSGIKTLAMIWLMISHLSMSLFPYVKNVDDLLSYYMGSVHGSFVLQGQHGVPLFFIISGLLFGFKYLNQKTISWERIILWRYFRLMPMYLVVYAYSKKFAHLIGDGPLWDSAVSEHSEMRQCLLESWWVPLLMLSNFTPPYAHCLITGWHIANDFQIYLVLPALLLAYRRSRRCGTLVALSAFALTHLSHMWFWGTADNYDLSRLMKDPVRFGPRYVLDRLALDYVNPLGRFGTYFVGVLLADLLLAQERLIRRLKQAAIQVVANNNDYDEWTANVFRGKQEEKDEDEDEEEKERQQVVAKSPPAQQRRRSCERGQKESETTATSDGSLTISSAGSPTGVSVVGQLVGGDGRPQPPSSPTERVANVTFCKRDACHQEERLADNDDDESWQTLTGHNNEQKEKFHRRQAHGRQMMMMMAGAGSAAAPAAACKLMENENRSLTSYKARCVLAFGAFLLVVGLFSPFIGTLAGPLPQAARAYASAIVYPLCRLIMELGWLIVLHYFISTNLWADAGWRWRRQQPEHSSGGPSAATRETTATTTTTTMTSSKTNPPLLPATPLGHKCESTASPKTSSGRPTALFVCLKWPIWNVLVKVNYSVMLTHYALFRFVVQSRRDLFLFTWFNFGQTLLALVLLSYLLGLALHLAVEMPLSALVQMFVSRLLMAAPPLSSSSSPPPAPSQPAKLTTASK
jgi:peptidoglycan/LPS O-acetylase OafA/YrhL